MHYSQNKVKLDHFSEGSPGPAYFINPKITRTGTDGTPMYSMLARREGLGKFLSCDNLPSKETQICTYLLELASEK